MNLSVVGLGKLGLCTAACFAAKGHRVVGVEKNSYIVEALRKKKCPIDETGLPELLEKSWDSFTVTMDVEEAVAQSDITLIIVPTPSEDSGRFTNKYVEAVLRELAPALQKKESFHIVDVVSTVMPGSSEKEFVPLLEELTGKVCGEDFGFVYNPEFIALGSVIRDFLNPDMVLIGASDERSGNTVKEIYTSTCDTDPYIAMMSLTNAEITKLSLNCYVTMKISFANELASICENVPGANIDVITQAIGADSRVGRKYLTGGLGFGGPCFPRDNLAFQAFAEEWGAQARLGKQVVAINHDVVDRIFSKVSRNVEKGEKVALFGLSYKPGTHIIEESQSIMLARKLADEGYEVAVHDPKALQTAQETLQDLVQYCESPYECAESAAAVVLLTNWDDYNQIDWNEIEDKVQEKALLLDCWRMLKEKSFEKLHYIALGLGEK